MGNKRRSKQPTPSSNIAVSVSVVESPEAAETSDEFLGPSSSTVAVSAVESPESVIVQKEAEISDEFLGKQPPPSSSTVAVSAVESPDRSVQKSPKNVYQLMLSKEVTLCYAMRTFDLALLTLSFCEPEDWIVEIKASSTKNKDELSSIFKVSNFIIPGFQAIRQQLVVMLPHIDRRLYPNKEHTLKLVIQDLMVLRERKSKIEAIIRDLMILKKKKTNIEAVIRKTSATKAVNIPEFERFLRRSGCDLGVEVLAEAVGFAKQHKTWKFIECCVCSEKFSDCQRYEDHVRELHLNNFQPYSQPENVAEWNEMIANGVWKPVDTDDAVKIIVSHLDNAEHAEQWPICDDAERAVTLERVRGIFLSLIKSNKSFAARHVHWAIQYTIHQFEGIISSSQIRCHGLESPKIICFLGVSKLEELHEFLKMLASIFEASEHSDLDRFIDVELSSSALGIEERIAFSDDFSCLLLDEQKLNITNQSSSIDVCKYDVPMIGKCLELWTSERKSQRGKAEELIGKIREECSNFSTSKYRIAELSSKMEAIQTIDNICLEETKNREQCPEHVEQHYIELLWKPVIHFEHSNDTASKIVADSVYDVLTEALKALVFDRSGSFKEFAEEEMRRPRGYQKSENWIKLGIWRVKKNHIRDMAFLDAIAWRCWDGLQKYEQILHKLSTFDYSSIIVSLLKPFLQTQLEDQSNKDDTVQRSEVTTDALFKRLALDDQKKINKVRDNMRQKGVRRNREKNFRKAMESKSWKNL